MTKLIFNLFDADEQDLTATFEATHSFVGPRRKAKEKFKRDWFKSLKEAKKKNPEDWHLGDVEKNMVAKGWTIGNVDVVEVQY